MDLIPIRIRMLSTVMAGYTRPFFSAILLDSERKVNYFKNIPEMAAMDAIIQGIQN